MYNSVKSIVCAASWACLCIASVHAADVSSKYPGVAREATAKEVAAWDIDVRPDFKGLPPGKGSVAKGQDVWEGRCAQCHGIFGESSEVFAPLVGGTTADDIKTGHVARLKDRAYPARTMMMQVPTVSTIWDFINRAMPWNAPKSLSTDEVYAVTAYLLNLAGVVPDDYELSNQNIAEVQQRMPNRNGMTTAHDLWPGPEFPGHTNKPDTHNVACMHNCEAAVKVASFIPDYARDAHGNLADQNRLVGAQVGAVTVKPSDKTAAGTQAAAPNDNAIAQQLLAKYGCVGCHAVDTKIVGPAFQDVAKKYPGNAEYLSKKIRSGGSGVWGTFPMPAQDLPADDLQRIANWLAAGAAK